MESVEKVWGECEECVGRLCGGFGESVGSVCGLFYIEILVEIFSVSFVPRDKVTTKEIHHNDHLNKKLIFL